MNAKPLSINDLKSISAKEALVQNAVLSAIDGKVYQLAGQPIQLQLVDSVKEIIKVAIQFNGQNMVIGLTESFVNALLKDEGGEFAELNGDLLNLIIRLKLLPKLPEGVQFQGIFIGTAGLPAHLQSLPLQAAIKAVHAQTGEALNWDIALYALPQTSLGIFAKGFDFLMSKKLPSPLLKATVPMPLVVAKTSVPAQQLRDIAVGDVILIA